MRSLFVALSVGLLAGGCQFLDPSSNITDDLDVGFDVPSGTLPEGAYVGPDGLPAFGNRIGEECSGDSECRPGLGCGGGGTCEPSGTTAVDDGCVVSAECADGASCQIPVECLSSEPASVCGLAACLPSEEREEGTDCVQPGSCGDGLRCNLIGFTGVCEPEGTGDVGQTCETHGDCRDPLLCGPPNALLGTTEFTCQIPAAVAQDVFMPDAECEDLDPNDAFRVHFDVPGDDPLSEFYRLPFPNDVRLSSAGIDMSGHHNPGLLYIGGAFVDLYLDAVSELRGFSTNPTVFFRFSQNPDFGTIVGDGDAPTLLFLNIDPDSPGYASRISMRWSITTGRGKFICPRYMAVRPSWSSPLEHGTTYAVLLFNGLRTPEGDLATPAPDFAAMLGADAPGDARLQEAWDAYAPLRTYLDDQNIGADTLIGGTVFTTMDPDADLPAIRAGARAQDPPGLNNVTLCGPNVTGPCNTGERGACVNVSDDVIELHATYEAPIWQAGTRPYLFREDGGNFVFSGGEAQPQGTETMCLSMTIPRGDMPENGWPVVMFGHGTGGTFTSHISGGTASRVANIDLGDDAPVQMVSVGIDGVQHGPRRGDSDLSAETLFYNFVNPLTAVGNVQQGAADFFTLLWMLQNTDMTVDGVGDLRFDPQQIYFFGHSQGATVGGLFAAFEPELRGAIFSGAGGSLVLSLLNKTSPEDIAGGVEFVLTDGGTSGTSVGDTDPLLALLQTVIDPVDPLNVARTYYRDPAEDVPGLSLFMSYGLGDTYTPEPNQTAFARAIGLPIPQGAELGLTGFRDTTYPVSGNRTVNENQVTGVLIPAQPGDYDGHFVIFRESGLTQQSMEFLGTGVRDGIPTVSAP